MERSREAQVFSFAGIVDDPDSDVPGAERIGIARASSQEELVSAFKGWGFRITAVSTLEEVAEAVSVMEAITRGDPELPESDYVNCLGAPPPFVPEHTFTFMGHRAEPGSATPGIHKPVYAGFAVAPSADHLETELASALFVIKFIASLAESKRLLVDMQEAANGAGDCIDLLDLAAAA